MRWCAPVRCCQCIVHCTALSALCMCTAAKPGRPVLDCLLWLEVSWQSARMHLPHTEAVECLSGTTHIMWQKCLGTLQHLLDHLNHCSAMLTLRGSLLQESTSCWAPQCCSGRSSWHTAFAGSLSSSHLVGSTIGTTAHHIQHVPSPRCSGCPWSSVHAVPHTFP